MRGLCEFRRSFRECVSDLFGALPPDPQFTVAQIPDGSLREFSGPGLLVLSQRAWEPKINDRVIARLVASQWWGIKCCPQRVPTYGSAMAWRVIRKRCTRNKTPAKKRDWRAVDDFAVGALMNEEAAPISQAARLVPFTSDYRSVAMNKGAMLFHMLRAQMGDVAFKSLLHSSTRRMQARAQRTRNFEQLAIQQTQGCDKTRPNAAESFRIFCPMAEFDRGAGFQAGVRRLSHTPRDFA